MRHGRRWMIDALTRDEINYVVQVNGKLRSSITMPADATKEACESAARADEGVQKYLDGVNILKVIVVPGKLVNIVAK